MKNILLMIMMILAIAGCKTKEKITETLDSASRFHLERIQGVNVSSSSVSQYHFGERLHTIILNEKGDTVKDKEFVCISDKQFEIYKDSVAFLKAIIDSLNTRKDKYIRYTVTEKLPWWKKVMVDWAGYVIGVLLAVFAMMFVIYRRRDRTARQCLAEHNEK